MTPTVPVLARDVVSVSGCPMVSEPLFTWRVASVLTAPLANLPPGLVTMVAEFVVTEAPTSSVPVAMYVPPVSTPALRLVSLSAYSVPFPTLRLPVLVNAIWRLALLALVVPV